MYSIQTWGDGHSHERIITDDALNNKTSGFKRWELFMSRRYPDGVRKRPTNAGGVGSIVWSIGYGHAEDGDNEPKVIPADMELTEAEASDLLRRDIEPKARWVNARIKVPLTTYMFASLTSLAYQFGQGRLDAAARGERPVYNPDTAQIDFAPLIVEGERKFYPIVDLLNDSKYVKAFRLMLDLNFGQDGKRRDGLALRRAAEVGYAMTRKMIGE